mgnify:FL=1
MTVYIRNWKKIDNNIENGQKERKKQVDKSHYPAHNKKPEEYHARSGWQPDEKAITCLDHCYSSDQTGPLARYGFVTYKLKSLD